MKILYCIQSLDPSVGAPRDFVEQSATLQSKYNYNLEVACLDEKTAPWLRKFPAPVHALGPGMGAYGYSQKYVDWLKKNHKKFDVVVVHGIWRFVSFGTYLALKDTDKPYYVFPHGMLDRWLAYRYPVKHFLKLFYWTVAEHVALKNANGVLFTSKDEVAQARGSFSPYELSEVVLGTASSSAPPDEDGHQKESFYKAYPDLKGKPYLIYLNPLQEKKGCDLLLDAFNKISAKHPEVKLVLSGPSIDGYEQVLRNQIATYDEPVRGKIAFTGMLSGDTKWGALRAAEAFVLPSHGETNPRSVTEALSCSVPVLISNKVNIFMDIAQYECGIVEDDDAEGTERLLHRWFDLDATERKRMREGAKQCFVRRFEDQKFFPNYLAVLQGKQLTGAAGP